MLHLKCSACSCLSSIKITLMNINNKSIDIIYKFDNIEMINN